jgi:phenylalanyl-tRNA synthetase alpha chain
MTSADKGISTPDLQRELERIGTDFHDALSRARTVEQLGLVRQAFLGKKSAIRRLLNQIGELPQDLRVSVATKLNEARQTFDEVLRRASEELAETGSAHQVEAEWLDRSLPGVHPLRGAINPVTDTEDRCLEILRELGFVLSEGPEVEDQFYNFDALNIPKHHPARDLQDTFFVQGDLVLRTHTTSVQARVLAKRNPPPIKIVSRGRVYRNEKVDASHLAMFHQLEGVWLETGTSFAHLKWVLRFVAEHLYGNDLKLRFKPKFYPYTEPSVGMDIQCSRCDGLGCEACHGLGWVTVIGAGMIHPNVLVTFGYNPDKVTGFAFGWGTSRLAAQFYGISQIRAMYEQDWRFLNNLVD